MMRPLRGHQPHLQALAGAAEPAHYLWSVDSLTEDQKRQATVKPS